MLEKKDLFLFGKWNDHRNTLLVIAILLTEKILKIFFFKLNCSYYIPCRKDGKHEMCQSHHRRTPKSEQETHVKRMANQFIQQWNAELQRDIGLTIKIQPDMSNSEHVKMIYQEG